MEMMDSTVGIGDSVVTLRDCADRLNRLLWGSGDAVNNLLSVGVVWPKEDHPAGVVMSERNGQFILTLHDVLQAIVGNGNEFLSPIVGTDGKIASYTITQRDLSETEVQEILDSHAAAMDDEEDDSPLVISQVEKSAVESV